jgi:hypothetical protein
LARNGRANRAVECLMLGVDRKTCAQREHSHFDPIRSSAVQIFCVAKCRCVGTRNVGDEAVGKVLLVDQFHYDGGTALVVRFWAIRRRSFTTSGSN